MISGIKWVGGSTSNNGRLDVSNQPSEILKWKVSKTKGLTKIDWESREKRRLQGCLCPGGFSNREMASERLSYAFEGLEGWERKKKNQNRIAKYRDAGKDPPRLGTSKDESEGNQLYSAAWCPTILGGPETLKSRTWNKMIHMCSVSRCLGEASRNLKELNTNLDLKSIMINNFSSITSTTMRISQEPEESKPEMTPLKGNERQ